MKIGLNIPSLIGSRQLNKTSKALARSLERLSTGRRFTSAQEDSVGLSISERLNAQVRGIAESVKGANQAASVLAIADSAMGELTSILQQMRELSVQAANGTLSSSDRDGVNDQIQGLLSEYNRIVETTSFNGQTLLTGGYQNKSVYLGGGTSLDIDLSNLHSVEAFSKTAGSGTFQSATTALATGSYGVDLADLNGDGLLDLVSGNGDNDTISIQVGNGDGTFRAATTLFGDDVRDVHLVDVNNDSLLDIVASSEDDDAIIVALGNGDASFKSPLVYDVDDLDAAGTPNLSGSIQAGDLDGDGNIDLVAASHANNGISILYGNGDGTFQAVTSIDFGVAPYVIQLGDINNDGNLDIVGSGYDITGEIGIVLGNGDRTFAAADSMGSTENGGLKLADLNQDGFLDIVLAVTTDGGNIYTHLGNGDGTFGGEIINLAPSQPEDVEVVDFNNDGILDVVWSDGVTTTVGVSLGVGDGSFSDTFTMAIGANSHRVIAGDLNGDGAMDLVFSTTGSVESLIANTHTRTAITDLAINSADAAAEALKVIDNALESLSSERAAVGNQQNQLEVAIQGLYTSRDSLAAAYSDLVDVDIALETAELVRLQIMQQAQVAVLAQANVQRAAVLELLGQ